MKLTYRPEIDGLRAIAVGSVILYHPQISIFGYQPFKGGFRPKYGYDVDENGYLVPCEKEQSVIRLMKILRKKGNSYIRGVLLLVR